MLVKVSFLCSHLLFRNVLQVDFVFVELSVVEAGDDFLMCEKLPFQGVMHFLVV